MVIFNRPPATDQIVVPKGETELFSHAKQSVYVQGTYRLVENVSPFCQLLQLNLVSTYRPNLSVGVFWVYSVRPTDAWKTQ